MPHDPKDMAVIKWTFLGVQILMVVLTIVFVVAALMVRGTDYSAAQFGLYMAAGVLVFLTVMFERMKRSFIRRS